MAAPLREHGHIFVRVVHLKPNNMKTARVPLASGGHLRTSDIAVTIHGACDGNPDNSRIKLDPTMSSEGDSVVMLRGLDRCSLDTLTSKLHVWRVAPQLEYTVVDLACAAGQDELRGAITDFVHQNAIAPSGPFIKFRLECMAACRELAGAGYVDLDDGDGDDATGRLSTLGASRLSCVVGLMEPRLVCELRPAELALEDRTDFELVMLLAREGFVWAKLPSARNARLALQYTRGADKKWYSSSDTPNRLYMIVLLRAEEIFDHGIQTIPHWSPKPGKDCKTHIF